MRVSFNDNYSILYSETPNFQSKIKFVSQETINALKKNGEKIGFLADSINNVKAPKFYTEGIRTCTAGGLVKPNKEAIGFHYYDFSLRNFLNIKRFIKSLGREISQPERGLLVGGKHAAIYGAVFSMKNFRAFKNGFQKLTPNISLFESQKHHFSGTDLYYSLDEDTWYLCHYFCEKAGANEDYVKNLSDLKNAYRNIRIASGDRLFINEKEVTPKDIDVNSNIHFAG